MPNIPLEAWFVIGVIVLATIVAFLHIVASAVYLETRVHETKTKAAKLKYAYAAQLAELEARNHLSRGGVEFIGQASQDTAQAA